MAEQASETVPAKKGFFKTMMLALLALLLVAGAGGGGAWYVMKLQSPAAAPEGGPVPQQSSRAKVPTFLPLDSFTVNLADQDVERYAQVGITLELDDARSLQRIKDYMPIVRDSVLMVLSHTTSADLLERAGKERLAREIMRAVVKPLGVELDAEGPGDAGDADTPQNPVREVLFSNIIVQ